MNARTSPYTSPRTSPQTGPHAGPDIRTFRAPSPRAALEAVKAALGDEAVILETREVRGGLWGRPEVEVTAASAADPIPAAGHASHLDGAPPSELEGEVASLRRVVDDLRQELRVVRVEPQRHGPQVPPDALRLFRHLVRRGVDEPLAEELVRQALRDAERGDTEALFEAARAVIRKRLPPARPPWERDARRLLALVGPTGVGKTTTIAKIAARALLEAHLKVQLVTVDTYRIGASEHISRYGEILGIPVPVARDAAALNQALARTADADLVLIDTAGRSDAEALRAQAELLRSAPGVETHLVLSAAAGAREMTAAARRYRDYDLRRLVLTKLDEADGPGSVLAAAAAVGAPISCLADGQRVPDDLHAATGPRLVELVLGR